MTKETKQCIHPEHWIHSKKKKPLDIPSDAKYCIYCGQPQYDVSGDIESIKQQLSRFESNFARYIDNTLSIKKDVSAIARDTTKKVEAIEERIVVLEGKFDSVSKKLNEDKNMINQLCQTLLELIIQDPDMKKFGEAIRSFTSSSIEYISDIIIDEFLSEGKRLTQILKLVIEIDALLEGKTGSFVEKIKEIANETETIVKDYEPIRLNIVPFEEYISQNVSDFVKAAPVDMYINAVKDIYIESIRNFAKMCKQNIDKWAIIRFSRKDIELEKFIEKDIPVLFKIIEDEKDNMKPDVKSQIEALQQELFSLSGFSKIDLA